MSDKSDLLVDGAETVSLTAGAGAGGDSLPATQTVTVLPSSHPQDKFTPLHSSPESQSPPQTEIDSEDDYVKVQNEEPKSSDEEVEQSEGKKLSEEKSESLAQAKLTKSESEFKDQNQDQLEQGKTELNTLLTQLAGDDPSLAAHGDSESQLSLDNSNIPLNSKADKDAPSEPGQTLSGETDEDSKIKEIGEKASLLKEHDVLEDEIAQANKIKEDLKQELDENDGWVKILGNDSLLKKVIKEGVDNKRPLRGEICTIRLEGRLQSNQAVFESVDRLTFQLGDAEVVPGLDLAVPLMCKGEVSHVKVFARFAYSAKGLPPVVPPNADVEYEVELLDFEIEKDLDQLSVSERREIGIQKRERGNWWYVREEASLAIQCYRRALEFLDDVEGGINFPNGDEEAKTGIKEDLKQLMEDRLKTYNNMAAAQLKLQAYDAALKSVEAVLKCQPNNSKALFRKGKIHTSKGETDSALEAFKRVSELEPGTKAVLQEINQLQAKRKKEREGEKQLYQRMFKGSKPESQVNDEKSSSKRSFSVGLVVGGVVIALAGAMAYRYRFL